MKETNYFLAICKDRPQDPDGFYYTIYFVNSSDQMIEGLSYGTGGFMLDSIDIIQTSSYCKKIGQVSPHRFVKVEAEDEASFDYVQNLYFTLKYPNGRKRNMNFILNKYFIGEDYQDNLPILNKPGYLLMAI